MAFCCHSKLFRYIRPLMSASCLAIIGVSVGAMAMPLERVSI